MIIYHVIRVGLVLALLGGGAGCSRLEKKEQSGSESEAKPKRQVKVQVEAPPPPRNTVARPEAPFPTVRPINVVTATVREVNQQLRFVILDFTTGRMPQLDQKLNVYRGLQKVGEIKISGPYRGTTVAADITAGEAKFGDLAKED